MTAVEFPRDAALGWRGCVGQMQIDYAELTDEQAAHLHSDCRREVRGLADRELADLLVRLRRLAAEADETGIAGFERAWLDARLGAAVEEGKRRRRLQQTRGIPVDARRTDRVERIKRAVDLADVIADIVGPPDQKRGRNWWWRCPFHADGTPSLEADSAKQVWCCFGCQVGGDTIRFVELAAGGLGPDKFLGALAWLEARYGLPAVEERRPGLRGVPVVVADGRP